MYETFNPEEKVPFQFSFDQVMRSGMGTKDFIAPTSFLFKNGKDFMMGNTMGAVSYLQILAPELTDRMLAEFLDMDRNLIVNLHIQSLDQMKAIKLVKSKVTDINRMKIEEQKKAVRSGYDMDIIPSDLNTYGGEAKRLLEDLQSRNERMFLVTIVFLNTAKTKQELDNAVFQTAGIAQKYNCSLRRLPAMTTERVLGMIELRDLTQELLQCQLEDGSDEKVHALQEKLNQTYDKFTGRYGLISSNANKRAFSQDSSYCLLSSLEILDEEGNLKRKADIFSKRTIRKPEAVTSVDTASEALAVSIGERAKVDIPFMAQLSGKTEEEVTEELAGVIFKNPVTESWETSDEYLSGNVREKLETARTFAKNHPEYAINVQALERVQPKDLDASEIEVRLGATWIEPAYITQFMGELFGTPDYLLGRQIEVKYAPVNGQWNVSGKNADYRNPRVTATYGTQRANAYRLLEDALNLRDTKIYDTVQEDGTEKRVLNKKETMLAQQKQEMIREEFKEWIFRDMDRRETLCRKYNELFNSIRPREYDGSHIQFAGMTPEITLMPHQKNAVAHILYGHNTLLAHCVGAGKTFQMIAAGMESKRLGLSQKNLYVVPNHLTEQWGSDFLRLYPNANVLVATKKDFEPANRKKFCSRIATGDYDAIIIGHSQFERIPLSRERQAMSIEKQIDEITMAIEEAAEQEGSRYTVKQMEKTRKNLETKLERLNDQSRKDDVVTFEQLGVDRLFVDESHFYKNLFLYTKMRNIAGIAQTDAQKSSDMFAKCQYLDEITGGRGVTFATGTPVSNSMVVRP